MNVKEINVNIAEFILFGAFPMTKLQKTHLSASLCLSICLSAHMQQREPLKGFSLSFKLGIFTSFFWYIFDKILIKICQQ
jgi:hypothetical protein